MFYKSTFYKSMFYKSTPLHITPVHVLQYAHQERSECENCVNHSSIIACERRRISGCRQEVYLCRWSLRRRLPEKIASVSTKAKRWNGGILLRIEAKFSCLILKNDRNLMFCLCNTMKDHLLVLGVRTKLKHCVCSGKINTQINRCCRV